MTDVMVFDDDFKVLKQPNFEICTETEYDHFIIKASYLYISSQKGVSELRTVTDKFENLPEEHCSIIIKSIKEVGVYAWDYEQGKWYKISDRINELRNIIFTIGNIYANNTNLPLEGDDESL